MHSTGGAGGSSPVKKEPLPDCIVQVLLLLLFFVFVSFLFFLVFFVCCFCFFVVFIYVFVCLSETQVDET